MAATTAHHHLHTVITAPSCHNITTTCQCTVSLVHMHHLDLFDSYSLGCPGEHHLIGKDWHGQSWAHHIHLNCIPLVNDHMAFGLFDVSRGMDWHALL